MDGQAALYASIAALVYVLVEILKAGLQHWRDKQKERERVERERQAEIERAAREKAAADKVAAEAKEVKEALAASAEKQDKLATEQEKVHKAVNSNWEAQKKELDFSRAEAKGLRELLEKSNLLKADERIAGLESLLQKVLKTNGIHSEVKSPVASEQLTIGQHETASVVITKDEPK